MRVIGYGLTTAGEADRYMEATLKEFERLCDDAIVLLNNASQKEKDLIEKYNFRWVEDNREWGKHQWKIKQDFVVNHVSKLNPDWCIPLDMDEVFDPEFSREDLEQVAQVNSYKFYIVNLYDDGYSPELSFENMRLWQWRPELGFEWEQKPVHCGLGPRWTYWYANFAPHFILHYGLKKESDRKKKQERYKKYDPDGSYLPRWWYSHLNNHEVHELNLDEIRKEVKEEVESLHTNHIDKSKNMADNKKKFYKMRHPETGEVFNILERNMERQRDRYGFELISEDPIIANPDGTVGRTVVDNTEKGTKEEVEVNYEDLSYKELQQAVSEHPDIDMNPVGKKTQVLINELKKYE